MSLMLRRAPSSAWLNEHWREEMKKTETCIGCGQCTEHCPQSINIPAELQKIDRYIEKLKRDTL
jgi:predicted aldo/keto reductase-like oxidoreductase